MLTDNLDQTQHIAITITSQRQRDRDGREGRYFDEDSKTQSVWILITKQNFALLTIIIKAKFSQEEDKGKEMPMFG